MNCDFVLYTNETDSLEWGVICDETMADNVEGTILLEQFNDEEQF